MEFLLHLFTFDFSMAGFEVPFLSPLFDGGTLGSITILLNWDSDVSLMFTSFSVFCRYRFVFTPALFKPSTNSCNWNHGDDELENKINLNLAKKLIYLFCDKAPLINVNRFHPFQCLVDIKRSKLEYVHECSIKW